MLPVEVELDVPVEIPVEAQVGHVESIRPEVGVGQAPAEDLIADLKVAVAELELDGTRPELPVSQVEGMERLDQSALLERFSRQDIAQLDMIAAHGQVDGLGAGRRQGEVVEAAVPGPQYR